MVLIKSVLRKSLSPDKRYGVFIQNQVGIVRQKLDDGYWLVEFAKLWVIRKGQREPLQWYVHIDDLENV